MTVRGGMEEEETVRFPEPEAEKTCNFAGGAA
jgi:hypothetical protein